MNLSLLTTFLTGVLCVGCSNGQNNNKPPAERSSTNTMDNFEYSFQSAHPRAQALMTDSFYWSPIEETAPFGSDDGSDAGYGFRKWRLLNKTTSPVTYLNDLIKSWQYPPFDYHEMDTLKIKEYIFSMAKPDEITIQQQMQLMKTSLKNHPDTSMKNLDDKQLRDVVISTFQQLGGTLLLGQDNAIIATGFAQIVLEGHIDADIKALTITAINRQLLPMLINRYDDDYRGTRKQQLTKMLEVVNKIN